MVEFNPDGSIKLSGRQAAAQVEKKKKLSSQQAMAIRKDLVYTRSPKKCALTLELSQAVNDPDLLRRVYRQAIQKVQTPTKFFFDDARNAKVEIGSDFRRCSDCRAIIAAYRERFDGNILVDKGTCPIEDRAGEGSNFSYEDHFE